ncbi:restriction endonuclease subunit S [Azotobacter vinelandii]|uniref:restriction endonuclease subunit S n=1 Tax=Azotobacter vinelandii TaxID=354 RepID=UPI002664F826|nr:restriction endonuclease subunit S [Azotobacter vinelandii]WKN21085.1 restriction endonuclease subunit S [Azotobacter vinelandii]
MKMIPLAQLVQVNPRMPRGLEDSREISFVAMASVSENGGITRQETRKFSEVKKGFTYFERGDVLLAKITPCFENGKSAFADNLQNQVGFGSTEFHVLRSIPEKIDAHFLYHLVRSKRLLSLGRKSMKGAAGHKRVPADFLETFEVPAWRLDDQIRIAYLLSKAEGLITQRKQHLQHLDDLVKSVFLEMFGDPVRNEKGWEPTTIGQIIKVASGNGLVAKNMNAEGLYKVYGGNGVNGVHSEYMFDSPTLVIGRVGYYCGSVHITEPKSWVTDNALYVKEFLKKTDLIFLKHLLAIHDLNKVAGRAAQPLVSGSRIYPIRTIDIPFENQKAFSAIVGKIEGIKSRYQQSLTDLEALYGALSQQAFKGELDLSRVPLPAQSIAPVAIGDQTTVPEPVVQTVPAIYFPDTGNLLAALENSEARKALIAEWLEAYRQQLGDAPFSVQDFMVAASNRLTKWLQAVVEDEAVADEQKNRLAESYPSNDVGLDVNDYEHIKKWVFEALAAGALTQGGNKVSNRIELTAVQS